MIVSGIDKKPVVAPQVLAEKVLGAIDWIDGERGYCLCPGHANHSSKSAKKDCKVYLDNAPSIFCFHGSCKTVIDEANYALRRALWEQSHDGETFNSELTAEQKIAIALKQQEQKEEEKWRQQAIALRETIFTSYAWSLGDAFEESPVSLKGNPDQDWLLWLSLFDTDDTIWNGDVKDSGRPEMAKNFKTPVEWIVDGPLGNFTCPSTFQIGTFSRSNEMVKSRPYLVIESDTLSQDEMCAITKWMATFLKLHAILTTGGKSIHSWFSMPSPELFKRLQVVLPELGCDRALFKPSQPVRVPGVMRGDRWQSLLWFKKV